MRYFNLSPHRSGTRSFIAFCTAHGVSAAHWPGPTFDAAAGYVYPRQDVRALWGLYQGAIGQAEAVADLPAPLVYHHAVAQYPDALFILVHRKPAEWLASVRRHTVGRDLSTLERWFYRRLTGGQQGSAKLDSYLDGQLIDGYERFIDQATVFLRSHMARHVVLDLDSPELSEDLARAMGLDLVAPIGRLGAD